MNFFQHQDQARAKTKKLILLFLLAVIFTAACIGAIFAFFSTDPNIRVSDYPLSYKIKHFDWHTFGGTFLIVAAFIFIVSFFKKLSLSGGGKTVAEQLGGKLIPENTKDFQEKQLLNIVAEISIASGVPKPPVYLIEEKGINAFAAGFSMKDAVIGITRGALENLNRDELQGVIAHEFSHIFNGDMRINIRLISILAGILGLGIVGRMLLYSAPHGNNDSKGGAAAFLFLGFALIIIGAIGTLLGSIIKASVSRQREFLADASAVQYTRNPAGIASALKKIGALSAGSKFSNPKSAEFSHMFFDHQFSGFSSLMATHPPLKNRILAIEPKWDGDFDAIEIQSKKPQIDNIWKSENSEDTKTKKATSFISMAGVMMQNIGTIPQESINQAHDLINSIPQNIRQEIANPFGAQTVIYSLIIAENSGLGEKELRILQDNSEKSVFELTQKTYKEIEKLDKKFRLTLIDLTIPTLKQLSKTQYENFKKTAQLLIDADSKTNLFEWVLLKILFNSLDREFNKNYVEKTASYKLSVAQKEVALFLSIMAISGNDDLRIAEEIFNNTIRNQNLPQSSFVSPSQIKDKDLENAIEKLEKLYPLEKEKLLKLCVNCLVQNGILFSELELLRAFSSVLDCPMPLVLEQ